MMRYHHAPIRMTKPNAGEDAEQLELLSIADGNEKWYNHFRK